MLIRQTEGTESLHANESVLFLMKGGNMNYIAFEKRGL